VYAGAGVHAKNISQGNEKKTHDRSVEVARTVNCEFGCQMKDGNDELRCLGNVSLCEADCFESE